MYAPQHILVSAVFIAGCALTPDPPVPVVPPEPPVKIVEEYQAPYCPIERVEVGILDRSLATLPSRPSVAPTKKGERAATPAQLVQHAQKVARIEPMERGYFGQSGEHTYPWIPGKVYTVYLSKQQATGIFLPPGERLVSGLHLDPEAYEVKTDKAGKGDGAYDAITVRPLGDSGEVDVFLLTESSRRYLLHLVVGKVGMLAVTFEGAYAAKPPETPTPRLVLPKPTP